MDFLNIILVISMLIILFFTVQKLIGSKKNIKSAVVKKHELIANYEKQMRETINKYNEDKQVLKYKKMETLKQISKELSTNIFFDKEEVKNLIQKLANMH